MFSGKTSCGSALARLQLKQLKPLCVHLETQECFQVSLHSHTGYILRSFEAQNIMYLKSCTWPLRSTDLCFNQRDPEKLLANLHYFILLFFSSSFSLSLSFVLSLWLQYIWPKVVGLFFCGCKI